LRRIFSINYPTTGVHIDWLCAPASSSGLSDSALAIKIQLLQQSTLVGVHLTILLFHFAHVAEFETRRAMTA